MNDVPFAPPNFAIGIFCPSKHRHVRVMKPMMGRHRRVWIVRGRIGPPEIAQLFIDLRVARVTRKLVGVVRSVFIPSLDLIGNDGRFLERDPVDQRTDLRTRGFACEKLIRNSTDDFVTDRTVGARSGNAGHENTQNRSEPFQRRQCQAPQQIATGVEIFALTRAPFRARVPTRFPHCDCSTPQRSDPRSRAFLLLSSRESSRRAFQYGFRPA